MNRRRIVGCLAVLCGFAASSAAACSGGSAKNSTGAETGAGGGPSRFSSAAGGRRGDRRKHPAVDAPISTYASVRKVKNILTGLGPTDAEVAQAATPAGFQSLVTTWMATPQYQQKMMFFFGNAFQQTSLTLLNFEFQLRMRPGAFDLPYGLYGDNSLNMLYQNMMESFARTCLELISEGKPFIDVLTTQTFMMTTALKSLYMQIEMPYDIHTMTWKFNRGTRPPIAETLDPTSPNYMIFGYAAPTSVTGSHPGNYPTCFGDSTKVSEYPGNTYLFQALLGAVNRDVGGNNSPGSTNTGCWEGANASYFTTTDTSDWQMVTISPGTAYKSYDLVSLRSSGGTLPSALERVSFFTTPAFLSVWNTNDSNQHRVTVNQALLTALGQGFTSARRPSPRRRAPSALDGQHAVAGSVCYGCHQSLDPMTLFFSDSYSYNNQVNAPPTTGGSFGFEGVTGNGANLVDFGNFMGQVVDTQVPGQPVNRFAMEMTQKLCFFANSVACVETDPEMRRIALAFQSSNYDWSTLMQEMMTSPLVTDLASTATFVADGVTISISRRDQLCAALSNRLGTPDLCQIAMPSPEDYHDGDEPPRGGAPGRRVQPRHAVPGDPSRPQPVLSRGQRAGLRGHRRRRRRYQRIALLEHQRGGWHRGHGDAGHGGPRLRPQPRGLRGGAPGSLHRGHHHGQRHPHQRIPLDLLGGLPVPDHPFVRYLRGPMTTLNRRQALLQGLFGAAASVGMRAIATGLPAWFLMNPREADAQDATCLLTKPANAQFLVVSASSAGDSISCNCPGHVRRAGDHPRGAGGAGEDHVQPRHRERDGRADLVDADPRRARPDQLLPPLHGRAGPRRSPQGHAARGRHRQRRDAPVDLRQAPGQVPRHGAGGARRRGDRRQRAGVHLVLGAHHRSGLSHAAQAAPRRARRRIRWSRCRSLRDTTLDTLNTLFKQSGTPQQKTFLEAMAASQTQVRQLAESLATTLAGIQDNTVAGQALAAAALISAKVTPVVTLHIPFGGDNHVDAGALPGVVRSHRSLRGQGRRPRDPGRDGRPRLAQPDGHHHVRHDERLRPGSERDAHRRVRRRA